MVTNISYFGSGQSGAWRRDGNADPVAISVRRPAAEPAIIVGSRSHANPELEDQLSKLGPFELTSMGSSLKFCRVAEGLADFYPRLGPTCEWDTAAAQAYNTKETFLNPHFFVYGDAGKDWLSPFRE